MKLAHFLSIFKSFWLKMTLRVNFRLVLLFPLIIFAVETLWNYWTVCPAVSPGRRRNGGSRSLTSLLLCLSFWASALCKADLTLRSSFWTSLFSLCLFDSWVQPGLLDLISFPISRCHLPPVLPVTLAAMTPPPWFVSPGTGGLASFERFSGKRWKFCLVRFSLLDVDVPI